MNRLHLALKALAQLGFKPVALLALYRLGLVSGHYRRATQPRLPDASGGNVRYLTPLPPPETLASVIGEQRCDLLNEANEIKSGQYRLFGGAAVPLNLAPAGSLSHWTDYEQKKTSLGVEDIKFTWEPARFGWAVTLARAFCLTGDVSYAQSFWRLAECFLTANPAYKGPNWVSAQEAGIRLICLAFATNAFRSTGEVPFNLGHALAEHARRIPPTLVYARAQNNNHLLSEATALFTAAALLPEHPQAAQWKKLGWHWMNHCFQHQIAPDGTYLQHSMNYHRLMLQLALWGRSVARCQGEHLPPQSQNRLAAATQWLLERMDARSGRVPNLGHNDGAYILPLAGGGFEDYRPVAQAASRAFLGSPFLPPGPWDEMSLWLGDITPEASFPKKFTFEAFSPLILRGSDTWASLRAENYTTRPGQADLLHVDLWWRGEAIAIDPGTYQYNAPPPWENALACTAVHNTISVSGQDQMLRAGRFLWLDWPKIHIYNLPAADRKIAAFHEGYLKRFGVIHRRELSQPDPDSWWVLDKLLPGKRAKSYPFTLHWLVPDWPWSLHGNSVRLESPVGQVTFEFSTSPGTSDLKIQVIRAGKALQGEPSPNPIFGWTSPTYGVKFPALSLRISILAAPPVEFSTRITLG